ncbi:MAG: aminoglycoside phosphotransferase family protein [Nocardioides sp.]
MGADWHRTLPDTLAELAELWSVRIGRPLPGGSASYVVKATTDDGEARVVKVVLPNPDLADEARTLAAAGGRGYAVLHAHDPARRALLLEALGTSLDRSAWSPERQIAVLADTLREAWQVPLSTAPPVTDVADDKATSLRAMVLYYGDRLGAPCDPRVLRLAVEYAERRAADFDPDACVVVHGDPHPANALRVREPRAGAETGFVFVDPDGFRADPAYDASVVLRDWTARLTGGDARAVLEGYCDLLAEHTGLEWQRIWEWGFLERVSTGLYVMGFGADRIGRPFLDSAEALLD